MSSLPLAIRLAVALLALAAGATAAPAPRTTPASLTFVPGRVLVAADRAHALRAAPGDALTSDDPRVSGALASLGLDVGRRLGPRSLARSPRTIDFYLLESRSADFDPLAAATTLRATGAFRAVSPDYRLALLTTIPDDFYLPIYQWFIDDGGFADIRLPAAWDIERGDPSVVLAIIDTGVDTGHPDLATKIWHNPAEVPDNAVDDDGNGLVDDVTGWDFGTGDNDPRPERTPDPSGIDIGFHGTFCAGLAAAATDNAEGIAGAGWNCRLMPLKVSHPVDGLTESAITAAFAYAADQGASVISMSFGGPGDPGVPEYFQALVDMATAAGVVCVAAAGNEGLDTPVYPAACDDVIAVAATDIDNQCADFSNWGPWVDVAAPGSGMWSSICQNYEFDLLDQIFYLFLFGWDGKNPYMGGDGTSFACPLTAGVCGLIRSRYPSLTPQQVAAHLIATGDVVAYSHPIGPRVNAFAAVSLGPVAVERREVAWEMSLSSATPNPFTDASEIGFTLSREGTARLAVFDVAGRRVRELVTGTLAAGPHRARWDGRDDDGRRVGSGVYLVQLESAGGARERKLLVLGR